MRESKAPNGREEELLKAQVWCGEDDLAWLIHQGQEA
jgi:hypothetical protein